MFRLLIRIARAIVVPPLGVLRTVGAFTVSLLACVSELGIKMVLVGLAACLPADNGVNTPLQESPLTPSSPQDDADNSLDNDSQVAIDNVDDTVDTTKQSILRIVREVCSHTTRPSILVGGASLILHGSTRITNDLGFLVPHEGLSDYEKAKAIVLRQPHQKGGIASIDLLSTLNRFAPVDFHAIQPYITMIDGVRVPNLDVSLGAKVIAHFGRADGVAGEEKRKSDLADIHWISKMMVKQDLKVEMNVRDIFVCGPLNMLLVLDNLQLQYDNSAVEIFELAGGREFECDGGDKRFEEEAVLYLEEIEVGGYSDYDLKIFRSRKVIDPI